MKKINLFYFRAAKDQNLETVKYHLLDGQDADSKNEFQRAALHYAALNGDIDMINLLLENGANINIQDKWGKTPVYYAAFHNKIKALETLLDKDADISSRALYGSKSLSETIEQLGGEKRIIEKLRNRKNI